ncbi:MAG: hypothetical protein ACO1TE_29285 [Prosthecobacter sp.]
MSNTVITAGMVCDVLETITCQILAEEALRPDAAFDAVTMHRGSLRIVSGDLLTAERVLGNGALILGRISGSLVGIAAHRLQPSQVRHT